MSWRAEVQDRDKEVALNKLQNALDQSRVYQSKTALEIMDEQIQIVKDKLEYVNPKNSINVGCKIVVAGHYDESAGLSNYSVEVYSQYIA